jgi:hypothetical protein
MGSAVQAYPEASSQVKLSFAVDLQRFVETVSGPKPLSAQTERCLLSDVQSQTRCSLNRASDGSTFARHIQCWSGTRGRVCRFVCAAHVAGQFRLQPQSSEVVSLMFAGTIELDYDLAAILILMRHAEKKMENLLPLFMLGGERK